MADNLFSLDNDVFANFTFYAAFIVWKMCMVSVVTAITRFKKMAFSSAEDCKSDPSGKLKPILNDEDVERVKRVHMNDLENIVPFVLLGFLYVGTAPCVVLATWHFRVFVVARFLHTIFYKHAFRQPLRAISWVIGFLVNISMFVQIMYTVCTL
ncbi:PREDICTED: microsomal glutathione S-transferase 1-like [Priapulus caudatus]|uniref:Microsomal glutathione S-transferase 1 n=1 Tax=Priapulus caudatus TaxID=37621 RepID=A0ABM1DT47_PRICU|nr:PREDICTED: microsomal glutathione S-transferase 1-like [Priapulus caudatus]